GSRVRAAGGAVLGQDRLRRHGPPRRAEGAGRDRAGRAALPVAGRTDRRAAGPVRAGVRGGVAAGGAREHGGVELRPRPPPPPLARRLLPAPCEPARVGQPGRRQPDRPPAGAGGAARADARRPVRLTPGRYQEPPPPPPPPPPDEPPPPKPLDPDPAGVAAMVPAVATAKPARRARGARRSSGPGCRPA